MGELENYAQWIGKGEDSCDFCPNYAVVRSSHVDNKLYGLFMNVGDSYEKQLGNEFCPSPTTIYCACVNGARMVVCSTL